MNTVDPILLRSWTLLPGMPIMDTELLHAQVVETAHEMGLCTTSTIMVRYLRAQLLHIRSVNLLMCKLPVMC